MLKLTGHEDFLMSLAAFSPDGASVLTMGLLKISSDEGIAKIWNAASGQCILTLTGTRSRGSEVFSSDVVFSPDGAMVFGRSDDKTAKIFDAASVECVSTLTGHESSIIFCGILARRCFGAYRLERRYR